MGMNEDETVKAYQYIYDTVKTKYNEERSKYVGIPIPDIAKVDKEELMYHGKNIIIDRIADEVSENVMTSVDQDTIEMPTRGNEIVSRGMNAFAFVSLKALVKASIAQQLIDGVKDTGVATEFSRDVGLAYMADLSESYGWLPNPNYKKSE